MKSCDTGSDLPENWLLINFERSGGFAGMRMEAKIDATNLPPEEARMLRAEVEQADFFALPQTIPPSGHGADRFQYRITVDTGEQAHTVNIPESAITESMQPLLQHLVDLTRRR